MTEEILKRWRVRLNIAPLPCADWGYCVRCRLWNCADRQEIVVQQPKPDYNKVCADNVGDEGWGAW